MEKNNNLPAVKKEGFWNKFINFFRKKSYNASKTNADVHENNESKKDELTYSVYDSSGNLVKEIKLKEGQEVVNEERVVKNTPKETKVELDQGNIEKSLGDLLRENEVLEVGEVVDPESEERSKKGADRSNLKTKSGVGGGSLMMPHGKGSEYVGKYAKVTPELVSEVAQKISEDTSKIVKSNDKQEVIVVEVKETEKEDGNLAYADFGKYAFRVGTIALLTGILLTNLRGCTTEKEKDDNPIPPHIEEEESKDDKVEEKAKEIAEEIDEKYDEFLISQDTLEGVKHKVNEESQRVDGKPYYDQEEMEVEGNDSRDEQAEKYEEIVEKLKDFKYHTPQEKIILLKEAAEYLEDINGELSYNYDETVIAYDLLKEYVEKHEQQLENAGIDYKEEHEDEIEGINASRGVYSQRQRQADEKISQWESFEEKLDTLMEEKGDNLSYKDIEEFCSNEKEELENEGQSLE